MADLSPPAVLLSIEACCTCPSPWMQSAADQLRMRDAAGSSALDTNTGCNRTILQIRSSSNKSKESRVGNMWHQWQGRGSPNSREILKSDLPTQLAAARDHSLRDSVAYEGTASCSESSWADRLRHSLLSVCTIDQPSPHISGTRSGHLTERRNWILQEEGEIFHWLFMEARLSRLSELLY